MSNHIRLPGFTYDPATKRYYKTPPQNAPESTVTTAIKNCEPKINQTNLEKKIRHCVSAIHDLELYGTGRKNNFDLSAYDSILASKFTENLFQLNRNVHLKNLIDLKGKWLVKPYCSQLVACPESDLLFGVHTDDKTTCISQLDVKQLLKPSTDSYKLVAKNFIGHSMMSHLTEQVLPIYLLQDEQPNQNRVAVFCLMRTIGINPESSSFTIYHPKSLNEDDPAQLNYDSTLHMEIDQETLFCCDNFTDVKNGDNNKLAVGGINKVLIFHICIHNTVDINNYGEINLRSSNGTIIIRSIKFSRNGKFVYCGTNKGELHIINLSDKHDQIVNLNCSTIVDLDFIDDNELLISAHDSMLFTVDLRFVKTNKHVTRFREHYNDCKKIRFSRDKRFQTLTSAGQDNCVRVWSEKSGKLLRTINYNDLVANVNQNNFTTNCLLDNNLNQVLVGDNLGGIGLESSAGSSASNQSTSNQSADKKYLHNYSLVTKEQYQVVSSSDWSCLNKEKKPVMFGSNSNSIDVFF